jgi:LacI family transcriptional regulator
VTTIRDVAKRAGVAPITVSRVINNAGYVSHETRGRVEAAIAELNYVPNSLARSLRFKQTRIIALVLTDVTNPFWTTIARGVEDTAADHGFHVILCNTDESAKKQAENLGVLLQKRVDGILLAPVSSDIEPIIDIQKQKIAVVVVDRAVDYDQVDVVRSDSTDGARRLTQHLLDLGHQRIAILSGPTDVATARERVEGYIQALQTANCDVSDELIRYGEYTQTSGYEMTQQVLNTPNRPTAIFAANNFIAVGAVWALRDAGLEIPKDISVVTFDDIPPSMVIDPFLTVAAQAAYEMGKRATELLVERMVGQADSTYHEIVLPTEILIRRSTGPPLNGQSSIESQEVTAAQRE